MSFYIKSNGITSKEPEQNDLPNLTEIEFCKSILSLLSENKGIHRGSTSYGYKHILERHFKGGYISNGAFIQAAKDLGFSVEREDNSSLNAYFKFSDKDLKKALLTYLVNQHSIELTEENIEKIKEQLFKCQTKTPNMSINDLSELYKRYTNISLEVNDIFKIATDMNLIIKPNFDSNYYFNDKNAFGGESTLNISSKKMFDLLFQINQERNKTKLKIN